MSEGLSALAGAEGHPNTFQDAPAALFPGFFEPPEPYSKDFYLQLSEDILQATALLFAPCGLPRRTQLLLGEEEFVPEYGHLFQCCMDVLTKHLYEARGVSESRVAVTLHQLMGTEGSADEDVMRAAKRSVDALKNLIAPPAVVELPFEADATTAATALQQVLAMWHQHTNKLLRQPVDEAIFSQLNISIPRRIPSLHDVAKQLTGDVVAALNEIVQGLKLSYHQFVALVEVYQTEPCVQEVLKALDFPNLRQATIATELAPHPVIVYREALALRRSTHSSSDENDGTSLEKITLASNTLTDTLNAQKQAMEALRMMGNVHEALELYQQCVHTGAGFDLLPSYLRAQIFVGYAACLMESEGLEESDQIIDYCSQAISLDPGSTEAFQIRAKVRMSQLEDDPETAKAAATDVMMAFVLGGGTNVEEGSMLQEMARDIIRPKAKLMYAETQRNICWPQDWFVRSYFSTFLDLQTALSLSSPCTEESGPSYQILEKTQSIIFLVSRGQYRDAYEAIQTMRGELVYSSHDAGDQTGAGGCILNDEMIEDTIAARALNLMGSFYFLEGDTGKSLWAFESSCKLDPNLVDSVIKLGSALVELEEYEQALETLLKAESMAPKRADTHLHRASAMITHGDVVDGIRELEISRKLDPTNPLTWSTLGIAQFKANPQSSQGALSTLQAAVELFPDNLETWVYYGEVLALSGDILHSMEAFRKAASIDSMCPLPFVDAARAFTSIGLHQVAMKHLTKALDLSPNSSSTYVDLGQALLQEGNWEQAMEYFKTALTHARYVPDLCDALTCQLIAEIQHNVEADLGIKKGVHF